MLFKVYSVLDVNVGYGMPIVQDNHAVAMRNFENACCNKGSVYHTHPADFSLWYIADFDSETGNLESVPYEKICNAYDFVSRLKDNEVL